MSKIEILTEEHVGKFVTAVAGRSALRVVCLVVKNDSDGYFLIQNQWNGSSISSHHIGFKYGVKVQGGGRDWTIGRDVNIQDDISKEDSDKYAAWITLLKGFIESDGTSDMYNYNGKPCTITISSGVPYARYNSGNNDRILIKPEMVLEKLNVDKMVVDLDVQLRKLMDYEGVTDVMKKDYEKALKEKNVQGMSNVFERATFKIVVGNAELEANMSNGKIYFDVNPALAYLQSNMQSEINLFHGNSVELSEFHSQLKGVREIVENKTFFSKSFKSLFQKLECDEELKKITLEGNFNVGMNFIDIKDETIEYIPKGKVQKINSGGEFDSKNRQSMKIHRFFGKLLKGKGSEYDIKCLADAMVAYQNSYTVDYVKGKQIPYSYHTLLTRGWSTSSCMDKKPLVYFGMYEDPKFRLGIVSREGQAVGRFLEVTTDDGFVYNDRYYYKDEESLAWYNSWVDSKKLNRKNRNSVETKDDFYNVDKGVFKKVINVTLKKSLEKFAAYPYLDTIAFGKGKTLFNKADGTERFTFTSTGGGCSRPNMYQDAVDNNNWIEASVAVQIGMGTKSGEYTTVNKVYYSVKNGSYILK